LSLNALEAMSYLDDGPRNLSISTKPDSSHGVVVEVRDTGPAWAGAVDQP
jgi:C4-dicarboxylate-specific signal transduction histidine kinase